MGRVAPRRVRRLLAAAGVVLVVAAVAVLALTRLLGDDPTPSARTGTGCVPEPDAPVAALEERSATWVRFCPLADRGASQRLRHPQGVVVGDLAASVATSLWQTQLDRPVCTPADPPTARPTGLFRIEVGLADGRVAEIPGDTGCSTRDLTLFGQLETTLLMDAAAAAEPAAAAPAPITCPRRLTTGRTNRDGASADQLVETSETRRLSTVPLLPLPATTVDVCAYTGHGRRIALVEQWQAGSPAAESVRAGATLGVRRGATADCGLDPTRPSYVVVLTDQTGTARTLTIDGAACGIVAAAIGTPPEDTWLGLATSRLARQVARSRP
jgi:hypothetical protein